MTVQKMPRVLNLSQKRKCQVAKKKNDERRKRGGRWREEAGPS